MEDERALGRGRAAGYGELLRGNPTFRRLWIGQVVSQLGDWFNSIALYSLLLEYTGSGRAVSVALLCQLLPIFLFGPLAGIVADRVSRKRLLIATDVMRGLLVLGFLFVDHPDRYRWCYVLLFGQVTLSAFFLPARQAVLPQIVSRRELLAANSLSGVTWSVMLALGSGLGGIVASTLGRPAAFVLDSGSYFLSAAVLLPLPLLRPVARRAVHGLGEITGMNDMIEGFRYLARRPGLLSVLLVKTAWGISGGVLLLYTILGAKVFPLGRGAALSIGLLYAARGIGSGLGPVLARAFGGETPSHLRRAIGLGFLLAGASYLALSRTTSFPVALLLAATAHMGGSILWVFSTTLLHHRTDATFAGRVFAAEQAGVTLTMSISTWFVGQALDAGLASPRALLAVLGGLVLIPMLGWAALQRGCMHWYRGWDREAELEVTEPPL